ncbi:MAG TPA: YdeI/OmpD-associated family protein [Actinomycetota bacterium]|nr:YdeI/OmpD-associated family protein [Actinomycetota bacterium]
MSEDQTITVEDLLDAMAEADVLETFCQLPQEDQENFSRWIGMARDDESHWRRIHAFVSALRTGPFEPIALVEPALLFGNPEAPPLGAQG